MRFSGAVSPGHMDPPICRGGSMHCYHGDGDWHVPTQLPTLQKRIYKAVVIIFVVSQKSDPMPCWGTQGYTGRGVWHAFKNMPR